MIVTKAIKASRLKKDFVRTKVAAVAEEARKGMLADFAKTYETFADKPTFDSLVSVDIDAVSVVVELSDLALPANAKYAMLNSGAPPHLIVAVNKPTLRFRLGYQSKTIPGWIGSRASSETGDMRAPVSVQHKGFVGRDFEGLVKSIWEPRFKRLAEKALRDAARSVSA